MAALNDWPWHYWRQRAPDDLALRIDDTRLSWAQLAELIDQKSAEFVRMGVHAGDGVMLRGKNSFRLLLSYLGLLQIAARCLPLNPQLPAALLQQLLPRLDISHKIDLTEDVAAVEEKPGVSISHPWPSCHRHWQFAAWQPSRAATLTLTSGSSGLPKAAVHPLAAHLASAEGVLALLPFSRQDSWLLSLPLYHVSGQGIVWRWLFAGATLVLGEKQPLAQALQGCSHASLVPTQLWRLLEQQQLPSSLHDVLLGGAEIPLALTERAEQAGVRCWCGYGLTELASTVCAKRADGRPGVGQPLPGREVRIVDEEILVRADSLALGYWWSDGILPLTDVDGWFHTRDRGRWQQGELCVAGRLDNLFFSGGEGIQPEDVERILLGHAQINLVFIVPIDDAQYGQRPVAVIDSEGVVSLQTLLAWVEDKLINFQRPVAVLQLPEQLKNGGIKISRREVQQWVEQQLRLQ